jgi:hypothetical protein
MPNFIVILKNQKINILQITNIIKNNFKINLHLIF